jgi:glycosyltransferase involved in cell wall biosynthesis
MNILITSFSFPNFKDGSYDGKFIFSEALAYAENGANVRVLTPHYDDVDKAENMHERIRVFRFQYFIPKSFQVLKKPGIPLYHQRSPLAISQIPFLCLLFVVHILKHAAWADIIHAQWTVTALLALPAKWIYGKKMVVTVRGSDVRLLPKPLNRFIHYQMDAAIECLPEPWSGGFKKDFPARYIRLPLIVHNDASGVMPEDMKKTLEGKSDPFIILYVGRFDYLKIRDHKLPLFNLIHASKTLKRKDMNFHVFYVGDGEEQMEKEMCGLIHDFGLNQHVTLLGPKTNVLDYIQACHLGVGGIFFNAVSQEFTICSKPQILMSGKDNMDGPWQHGVNAILIKPEDQGDLAEKLLWAMENRDQARKIGENAKYEMKEYVVESKLGGGLYLREFQNLIN